MPNKCIVYSGERISRSNTQQFDFTVDEGKERLNPSREKNYTCRRQAPQKEGGEIIRDLPSA